MMRRGGTRMQVAVERIVETLREVPPAHFQPGEVCARLRGILLDGGTLSPYLHFAPHRYTRNLIYRNEIFELVALCWEPQTQSPIHNHSGQLCWLSIQRGVLRLENFISLDGPGPETASAWCRTEAFPGRSREPWTCSRVKTASTASPIPSTNAPSACTCTRGRTTSASLTTPSLAPRARCGCSTTPSEASSSTAARSNCSEACRLAADRAVRLRSCVAEEGGGTGRSRSPGRGARSPILASVGRRHLAGDPRRERALGLGRGGRSQLLRPGEAQHGARVPGACPFPPLGEEGSAGGQSRVHRRSARSEHVRFAGSDLELHQRRNLRAGAQPMGLLRPQRRLPGAERHRAEGRRLRGADLRHGRPQLPGASPAFRSAA